MERKDVVIIPDAVRGLSGGALFYPSAGADLEIPLHAFRPWISDFWFVDQSYAVENQYGPRDLLEDVRLEEVNGVTLRSGSPYRIAIRHETYRTENGRTFTIHACRGRGYDAFRSLIRGNGRKLSVFFHRGDSPAEGGSNFYWLGRKRLVNVLQQLEAGGLVVSDGSLALKHFRRSIAEEASPDLSSIKSFEAKGYRFECVGYLGHRYGPTIVWKTSQL